MLNETSNPRDGSFRFTLRGLMLLVVFAALGSLLVRYDVSRWHDGLIIVVVSWILVGVGNQLYDLLRALGRAENSSWNVRGTILIESVRRLILSLVLVAYLAWIVLHSPAVSNDEIRRKLSWIEWGMPESLFVLALISVMLLRAPPRNVIRAGPARIVRDVIIGAICCLWLFYLYQDRLLIHSLVQRAILGVLSRVKYLDQLCPPITGSAHDVWVRACVQSAITGTLGVALAIVFSKTLIHRWKGRLSKELFWLLPLGLSLGVAAWEVVWAVTTGLPNVEFYYQYFQESLSVGGAINFGVGGILLLLVTTEATLRIGQVVNFESDQRIHWRLRPRSYTHERQATLALLLVGVVGWLLTDLLWRGENYALVTLQPTVWRTIQASFPLLMVDSGTILKVACALLAAHVLWWQGSSCRPATDAPVTPLLMLKFCVVWVTVLTTGVLFMATILWLYYTACVMPR
jgi:hypothetical protein